jgi:hypothetical protein
VNDVTTDILPVSRPRLPSPFTAFRRSRERAAADRWLEQRSHAFAPNDAVRRRIAELTSSRERTLLAKSLLGAVRDAGRRGFGASPLNRRAVAEYADELTELAARLSDLDRPVAPRGVVLTLRLLTDGGSALYARERGAELPAEVARIRAALEGR